MIYRPVEELGVGDCVYNVYNPKTGVLLLNRNYKLDEKNIRHVQYTLKNVSIDGVWIYSPAIAELEKFYNEAADEAKRRDWVAFVLETREVMPFDLDLLSRFVVKSVSFTTNVQSISLIVNDIKLLQVHTNVDKRTTFYLFIVECYLHIYYF